MTSRCSSLLLTLLIVCTLAMLPTSSAEAADTYLLELDPTASIDLEAEVVAAGGTLLRVHPEIGYAVALADDPEFESRLMDTGQLRNCTKDIRFPAGPPVEELFLGHIDLPARLLADGGQPSDAFLFDCQWMLDAVDAPSVWAQGELGRPDVKVALLSTGVDPTHQDLAGKIDLVHSASFITPGASPCNPELPDEETFQDYHLVGTATASQITSNNLGVAGVAPATEIVAVKTAHCGNTSSFADLTAGLLYAATLPDVDVISIYIILYVEQTPEVRPLVRALNKAVRFATRRGKLVIASAGNNAMNLSDDGDFIASPTENPSVIGVYAVGATDELTSYTNYGFPGTFLGAPGGTAVNPGPAFPGCTAAPPDVQGALFAACSNTQQVLPITCVPGTYIVGTNTAFSSAITAGVAALTDGKAGGHLPPWLLRTILLLTADDLGAPGVDNEFGFGRVNAANAVSVIP